MRTIYPNAKAVGLVALVVLLVLFLLVSIHKINFHLASMPADHPSVLIARDVNVRKEVQKQVDNVKQIQPPFNPLQEYTKKNGAEIVEKAIATPAAPKLKKSPANEDKKQEVKSEEEKAVVAKPVELSGDKLVDAIRREAVVEMIYHTWTGYKNFSWGANELMPIAKKSHSQAIFGGANMMATIVDGADTLWLAGLNESYKEARDYIKDHFDISTATGTFSLFEVTIRHIGGFLSLYALTKEKFYMDKARSTADKLLLAFDTPTGIPKSLVNSFSKSSSNYGWAMGGSSILSEIGSLHLEFTYLSEITGNPIYRDKVQKVRDALDNATKINGLYPNYISPETGKFQGDHISLGAMGDSFYETLLKSWIRSRKDKQAYKMYKEASVAIRKHMLFKSKGGLSYLAELRNGGVEHKMGHLACFTPGMFALEAVNEPDPKEKIAIMQLAEDLGETCHESYVRAAARIGPEMFYFEEGTEAMTTKGDAGYILRPEVIEGWFYLWRFTKNKKYKEWVWDAVTALNKHCRVENGFVGLRNVYKPEQGYDDVQQSFWLAETLKYALLTFADEEVPLDKWVFNTEAHLFPIQPKT